jgi:hypothetical protein
MANATTRMYGPGNKVYEIPNEMVKQASNHGLRMQPPLPPVPVPQELRHTLDNYGYGHAVGDTVQETVNGAITGWEHGAAGLINLGRRAVGKPPMNDPAAKALITPTKEEKPAYLGEQAAEFMLPESVAGKLGFVGRTLGAGAVSLAQTGSPKEAAVNMAQGAAIEGGMTVGGAAIKRGGAYLLNNSMEMTKSVLSRRNPGEFAIENGVFSRGWNPLAWDWSKGAMRQAGSEMASSAAEARDQIAAASSQTVSIAPAKQIAQDAVQRAAGQNDEALMGEASNLYQQLNEHKQDITHDPAMQKWFPDSMQQKFADQTFLTTPRLTDNLSVPEAIQARQGLGAAKPWNSNPFFTPRGNVVRDQMYGALNEQIHMDPRIASLDETYSSMAPFGKSVDNKPTLWPTMVAAGAGFASGGPQAAVTSGGSYLAARAPGIAYGLGRAGLNIQDAATTARNIFLAGRDTQMLPQPFLPHN